MSTTIKFTNGIEWRIGVVQLMPDSLHKDRNGYWKCTNKRRMLVIPPTDQFSKSIDRNATKENPVKLEMSNGNYWLAWWEDMGDPLEGYWFHADPYLSNGSPLVNTNMFIVEPTDLDWNPNRTYDGVRQKAAWICIFTDGTTSIISSSQYQYVNAAKYGDNFATGVWTPSNAKFDDVRDGKVPFSRLDDFPPFYDDGYNTRSWDFLSGVIDLPEIFPGEDNTDDDPGGNLPYDPTSIPIPFSDLPQDILTTSGLINLYNPNGDNMLELSNWLWSNDLIDQISKMWQSPMEGLISLSVVPYSPNQLGTTNIQLGNITSNIATANISQFHRLSCGSVSVPNKFGTFSDYNPYTKCSIFLPFVGMKPLDIDDVMGGTISVQYQIDNFTGSAVCEVHCAARNHAAVMYQWSCNVAAQVPLSGSNMQQLYRSILTASAAVAAPVVLGATGGLAGGALAVAGVTGAATAIGAVTSAKSSVERGGRLDGVAGALGQTTPYIILHRPSESRPNNYQYYNGYPSNITAKLGDLTGFTAVDKIRLTGFTCTDGEKDQIEELLKAGVIL